MTHVRLVDVDGVRVVLAHGPGPARGGVVVRAGTADETQLEAGTAHLVEHLALAGLAGAERTSCGTGHTLTRYRFTGPADVVRAGVAAVCARLADLPTGGLHEERSVVAAEREARGTRGEEHLLRARYGLLGYGSRAAVSEYGLARAGADEVSLAAYAAATSARCVVWLTGAAASGDLPAVRLRRGVPVPSPDPRPGYGGLRRARPGWVRTPIGAGGVLGVVDRGPVTDAFVALLAERLVPAAASLVYDGARRAPVPRVVLDPVTADAALLLLGLMDERAWAGWTARFTRVLERLTEEVEGMSPRQAGLDAEAVAADLVLGVPEARAVAPSDPVVSPDQVTAVARRFLAGAVAGFDRVGEGSRDWVREPLCRQEPVEGRDVVSRDAPTDRGRLVLGRDGITLDRPPGLPVTVRVTSTAAVLRWPDGRRQLVGDDGSVVVVEPTLWVDGARVVAAVDATWPVSLVVERAARAAEQVPQPDYGTDGRAARVSFRGLRPRWRARPGRAAVRPPSA
jgi:hypothetical protein